MRLGMLELLFVFMTIALWLIPIAAGAWALITLHHIRTGQDALRQRVEEIDKLVRGMQAG